MKEEIITQKCQYCGDEVKSIIYVNEDGEQDIPEPVCEWCAKDYVYSLFQDEFREMTPEQKSEVLNNLQKLKMDEKLGSRQYVKLEPAQKILNTLLMTLGSDWLKENLNNEKTLEDLVDIAIKMSNRLVESLYEEQNKQS